MILECKMPPANPLKIEQSAISQYLSNNWDSDIDMTTFVDFVAKQTELERKYLFDALDYSIGERQLIESRRSVIATHEQDPDAANFVIYYDSLLRIMESIDGNASYIQRGLVSASGYEDIVKRILKAAIKVFPGLTNARPKGWHLTQKDNSDIQETNPELELKNYAGDQSMPSRSEHFVQRVSLAYLDYQQKHQGRQPLACLVGAIYAQLAHVQTKVNTQNMLIEMEQYVIQAPKQAVFNTRHNFSHPVLQAISLMTEDKAMPTEAEFKIAVADAKVFNALDAETKRRISQVNRANLMNSLDISDFDTESKFLHQKAVKILEKALGIKPYSHTYSEDCLEP
jgi:hypothetical protein